MIAIIDYGMGNLRSVQKAIERTGVKTAITQKAEDIRQAKGVILPGVGAMQPAMEKLQTLNLVEAIRQTIASGKPFLGICLGCQLLFEKSSEGGETKGLGVLAGTVERFNSLKVPHMGWNQIKINNLLCPLFNSIKDETNVYFCHSYYVKPKDPSIIAAATEYGKTFASAIHRGNLFGVQFHPEKSQTVGLQILNNFTKLAK